MAWLVSDARVLASAEVMATPAQRRRGLLGRRTLEGAIVLRPCRAVHTIGMRFAIDVGFLDADGVVLKTVKMRRFRLGLPVRHAASVIEARAGSFERWNLQVGDVVEVRQDQSES
jgi:uncharacterized membrane protein (UPF0127 family)